MEQNYVINGVSCIKGEIHSIMTLMRLNTRWSQLSRNHSYNMDDSLIQNENPCVKSFRKLNEYLEGIFDLHEVDCMIYISPFHQIIVSDLASGPLTSAALSSLSKFALYGFLNSDFPRVREGISLIASCIAKCVFEETDWESDEVILMKLLELSVLVYRCSSSSLLSVGTAWDIYSTCISIHCECRASKILKSEAETCLRHLTLTAFSRVNICSAFNHINNFISSNNNYYDIELSNQTWEVVSQETDFSGLFGITILLSKIMSVLSSLMDLQKQTIEEVKFALQLVNIALEAGGPVLGSMGPVVDVLRGDICRHLLKASQSDDLAIFSLSLRVVFNLFMSIKNHMKVQLEVFLTSVHLRILAHNSTSSVTSTMPLSPAREELALESLLEFCREPSLMQDLYTNYDCDVQCTNLFDAIVTTLCNRAIPQLVEDDIIPRSNSTRQLLETNSSYELNCHIGILNRLALDGAFAILHTVASRCNIDNIYSDDSSNESLNSIPNRNINTNKLKLSEISTPASKNASNDIDSPVDLLDIQVDRWCTSAPSSPEPCSNESNLINESINESGSNSNSPVKIIHNKSNNNIITLRRSSSSPFSSDDILNIKDIGRNRVNSENNNSGICLLDKDNDEDIENELAIRAKTALVLKERKIKKQKMTQAAEMFNAKPLKGEWLRVALELGLISLLPSKINNSTDVSPNTQDNKTIKPNSSFIIDNNVDIKSLIDPKSVAKFFKNTPGLGKVQLGEYLSKGPSEQYPFHEKVLKCYCDTFDFTRTDKSSSFDKPLRLFLGYFRLPGEAQCIDRLMEAFAKKLFENLGKDNPFASADAAFILAFSTIMLNTDLHNPNLPDNKRMTLEHFYRNNRKINDGEDLPNQYLEELYNEIKGNQIQLDLDINDTGSSQDFTDTITWNKLLRKSESDQAPAAFTPTVSARRNNKRMNLLSPSIHEKDMFLVIAKPVLQTIIKVWEVTNNDQIIKRIVEGIWDYSSICIGLNLNHNLSQMIRAFTSHCQYLIEVSRKLFHDNNKRNIKISFMEYNLNKLELSNRNNHDLNKLINVDFPSLLSKSRYSCGITSDKEEGINWTGAHIIKGELLLKIILYISNKFSSNLDSEAWLSVVKLLLWIRRRGVLPESLVYLGDVTLSSNLEFHVSNNDDKNDDNLSNINCDKKDIVESFSNKLPLSSYALNCIYKTSGKSMLESGFNNNNQSESSWWAGWFASEEYKQEKLSEINFYNTRKKEKYVFNGNTISHLIKNNIDDKFLQECLLQGNVQELIINLTTDWDEDILVSVISSLLELITNILSTLVVKENINSVSSLNYKDKDKNSNELIDNDNFIFLEIDAVILLEWIINILFINKSRAHFLWPLVHVFMRSILEDKVDNLCISTPYFIERCIVTIIRATSTLGGMKMSSLIINNENESTYKHPLLLLNKSLNLTPSSSQSGLRSVWLSLRLMRGIPSEILANISNRLGAGMLSLLKFNVESESIFDLEQWYMVFSLLSAATCGLDGRPYVWESICYLIENNHINDMNFTPCRHLVLRFLHGVFLGDITEDDNNHPSDNKNKINPWQIDAMVHLMILTNMALAGYSNNYNNNVNTPLRTTSLTSSSFMSPLNHPNQISNENCDEYKANKTYVTFPLPKSNHIGVFSVKNDKINNINTNYTTSSINEITNQSKNDITSKSSIKIISIKFSRSEEVELLWLESCKAFADLTNILPLEVTKRSIFCLQSIFLSAEISGMPDDLWLKSIQELVNRLPISLPIAYQRLTSGNDSEIIECCLRSCNVIFEMIITYKRKLGLFNEFPTFWLRFISALATNTNMVNRGLPLHDEMLEMITALLRLLPNPAKSSLSITSPINNNNNNNNTSVSQKQPSSLWSYIAPSFFSINSNDVIDTSIQTNNPPCTPTLTLLSKNSPDDINQNIQSSPLGSVTGSVESDAALLKLSWTTLCSLCPSLQATLKLKNPKLVADLVKLTQLSDFTQLSSIKSISVSVNDSNSSQQKHLVSQQLFQPVVQIPQVSQKTTQFSQSIINDSNEKNPDIEKFQNVLKENSSPICIENSSELAASKISPDKIFLAATGKTAANLQSNHSILNNDYSANASFTVSSSPLASTKTTTILDFSVISPTISSSSILNQLESIEKTSIESSLLSPIGTLPSLTPNNSPGILKAQMIRSANMRKLDSRTQVV